MKLLGLRAKRLWYTDPEAMLIWSALCAIIWGVVLCLPSKLFDNAQIYRAMAGLAAEDVWGVAFLAIGFGQLLSVALNTHKWRAATFIAALFWVFVSATFWLSNPSSVGGPLYTLLALSQLWVYERISG